jgi:transporter family-2 protein
MNNLGPLLAAVAIGGGAAVQTALIGAMGRQRGAVEASWLSLLATITGIALILAVRTLRAEPPALPAPFERWPLLLLVAACTLTALLLSARGLPAYYAGTGLFAIAFLIGAGSLGPKLGVALFLSATIGGQVVGALALDQVGAFGAAAIPLTPARIGGVVLLLAGVLLVRFGH